MVYGHRIVRLGRLDGYWELNSPVEVGRVRYWVRERMWRTALAKVAEEVGL